MLKAIFPLKLAAQWAKTPKKTLPAPILSDRMQDHVRFALIGMGALSEVTFWESQKANLSYMQSRNLESRI